MDQEEEREMSTFASYEFDCPKFVEFDEEKDRTVRNQQRHYQQQQQEQEQHENDQDLVMMTTKTNQNNNKVTKPKKSRRSSLTAISKRLDSLSPKATSKSDFAVFQDQAIYNPEVERSNVNDTHVIIATTTTTATTSSGVDELSLDNGSKTKRVDGSMTPNGTTSRKKSIDILRSMSEEISSKSASSLSPKPGTSSPAGVVVTDLNKKKTQISPKLVRAIPTPYKESKLKYSVVSASKVTLENRNSEEEEEEEDITTSMTARRVLVPEISSSHRQRSVSVSPRRGRSARRTSPAPQPQSQLRNFALRPNRSSVASTLIREELSHEQKEQPHAIDRGRSMLPSYMCPTTSSRSKSRDRVVPKAKPQPISRPEVFIPRVTRPTSPVLMTSMRLMSTEPMLSRTSRELEQIKAERQQMLEKRKKEEEFIQRVIHAPMSGNGMMKPKPLTRPESPNFMTNRRLSYTRPVVDPSNEFKSSAEIANRFLTKELRKSLPMNNHQTTTTTTTTNNNNNNNNNANPQRSARLSLGSDLYEQQESISIPQMRSFSAIRVNQRIYEPNIEVMNSKFQEKRNENENKDEQEALKQPRIRSQRLSLSSSAIKSSQRVSLGNIDNVSQKKESEEKETNIMVKKTTSIPPTSQTKKKFQFQFTTN